MSGSLYAGLIEAGSQPGVAFCANQSHFGKVFRGVHCAEATGTRFMKMAARAGPSLAIPPFQNILGYFANEVKRVRKCCTAAGRSEIFRSGGGLA
jgi:hypothetical protein